MENGDGRWYNFYEAVLFREFDRLDWLIDKIKRKEKSNDVSFYLAEAKAKHLFENIYSIADFWIEDLFQKPESLPKVDSFKYALEVVATYKGRGKLKGDFPLTWTKTLNETVEKLSKNFKRFSKYTKEFAQYLQGWSLIKLKDPPQVEVVNNPEAEAYALLFGFHGSVRDVTDSEYESCKKRVSSGEYMLPGIVAVYEEISVPLDFLSLIGAVDFDIFLQNYLAKDESEWENIIYPQIKDGLYILKQFLRKKGKDLARFPLQTTLKLQQIMESWRRDIKEKNIMALDSHASTIKARKELADKYEYGIEPVKGKK